MCITVNDAFAADAWAQAHGAEGKVVMLADARVRGSETAAGAQRGAAPAARQQPPWRLLPIHHSHLSSLLRLS